MEVKPNKVLKENIFKLQEEELNKFKMLFLNKRFKFLYDTRNITLVNLLDEVLWTTKEIYHPKEL